MGQGAGLAYRGHRALLEITGKDRHPWLHNLTTNEVKALAAGDGNYAFVLNAKGRILFDVNILVGRDSIRLDLEQSALPAALAHLNKYIITEDVQVHDRSAEYERLGISGGGVSALLEQFGAAHARNLAQFGRAVIRVEGVEMDLFRHDFCGPYGVELLIPPAHAEVAFSVLTGEREGGAVLPVGREAVEIRRIEAGIPALGSEITDDVLPAETGQLARAVSFRKGCYLGQEVVERMRSRHVVARQLVGLVFEEKTAAPAGSEVVGEDEKPVGKVTSSCHSIALGRPIALAYVRTALGEPGTCLTVVSDGESIPVTVNALPFPGVRSADALHAS